MASNLALFFSVRLQIFIDNWFACDFGIFMNAAFFLSLSTYYKHMFDLNDTKRNKTKK